MKKFLPIVAVLAVLALAVFLRKPAPPPPPPSTPTPLPPPPTPEATLGASPVERAGLYSLDDLQVYVGVVCGVGKDVYLTSVVHEMARGAQAKVQGEQAVTWTPDGHAVAFLYRGKNDTGVLLILDGKTQNVVRAASLLTDRDWGCR